MCREHPCHAGSQPARARKENPEPHRSTCYTVPGQLQGPAGPYNHEWRPSISATLQGCPHYTLPHMCLYTPFGAGTTDPHNRHIIAWTVRATSYRWQRTTMKHRSTYMHATYLIVPSAKQPILGQSVIASKLQLTLSCRATWLHGYYPFLLSLRRKGGMMAALTSPRYA